MEGELTRDFSDGVRLSIFLNQNDHIGHVRAAEAILKKALALGLQGGSSFRAIEGFGQTHHLERGHILSLDDDRGEMIVIVHVDDEKIDELLDWLEEHLKGVLVCKTQASFYRT